MLKSIYKYLINQQLKIIEILCQDHMDQTQLYVH